MAEKFIFSTLERSLADGVFRHALEDAAAVGLPLAERDTRLRPIQADQQQLLGTLAGLETVDIIPLIDKTVEKAGDRLAPWGKHFLNAISQGEDLDLYLASLIHVQPLLDAWGQGIEEAIPGIRVPETFGNPLAINSEVDQNTGERKIVYSAEETGAQKRIERIEELQATGQALIVADSFVYGSLTKGRWAFLVNGVPKLRDRVDEEAQGIADGDYNHLLLEHWPRLDPNRTIEINWATGDPETELFLPGELDPTYYNLGNIEGRYDFLDALARHIPILR